MYRATFIPYVYVVRQFPLSTQRNTYWECFFSTRAVVFDRDGSGRIEVDELRYTLRTLGEQLSDADLDEMLKAADRNSDGNVDIDGENVPLFNYALESLLIVVFFS